MEPKTAAQKRKGPAAALCTNGCGFFGAAENEGMCSKCYSQRRPAAACQKRKADHSASVFAAVPPPLKKIKLSDPAIGSSSDAAAAGGGAVDTSSSGANAATPAKPATATANRCMTCRKKVGLTGFRCRCGGTFCGSHRHADAHSCGYDYKAAGREQIAKQNPVVVAAKIAKI